MVKVGDAVIYNDELNSPRNALVVNVHNQDYINLIVVSTDVAMTDNYGRQTCHVSSVGRLSDNNKAGRNFVEKE